jgi:phospholipid/cholesterol/gamma-HCH transport system substrate-binding protein
METRAHYVAVGAFVLATLFLAFVAVVWLAGTQFTNTSTRYYIYFEGPVSGLSTGAKVEYNGIPVGTVSDIDIVKDKDELAREENKPIRVTVEIKNTIDLKKSSAASIQTNILSGVSFILISPGKTDDPLLTAEKSRETYPVIRSRRSTFSSLAARGPQLLDKLDDILDHVDELLNDHNRQTFNALLDHLQSISSNLDTVSGTLAQHGDELVADAGQALKSAAALFTDLDQSYSQPNGLKDQVGSALGDFDKLVKGLGDTNHQLDQAVVDLRPGLRNFSQKTLGDIDALVGEVRQFVSGLSRLASQLERDPTRLLFGDRREGYQPK